MCHHGHARAADDVRLLPDQDMPADKMANDRPHMEERNRPVHELTPETVAFTSCTLRHDKPVLPTPATSSHLKLNANLFDVQLNICVDYLLSRLSSHFYKCFLLTTVFYVRQLCVDGVAGGRSVSLLCIQY